MDVKEYFEKVNKFIDNLTDEQFDALLIESGIEKCPYEEFKRVDEESVYCSFIKPTDSISISVLENYNVFEKGAVAA